MSIHWYAHHLGDYAKDTQSLSMMEHGAYRLLLDYYYSSEKPIIDDLQIIYRICRALHHREKAAVRKVLSKYFLAKVGVWYHERVEDELQKARNLSEIRKDAACKRYAKAGANADTTYNHIKYNNGFEGKKNGTSPEGFLPSSGDQKRARISNFQRTGIWRNEWGEKPN